jgi:hypothetical protein
MKSAYELAMEKLEQTSGKTRQLSDEERKRLAEIDAAYDAKEAETKLTFESRIAAADPGDRETLRQQLVDALKSLETEREEQRASIWKE